MIPIHIATNHGGRRSNRCPPRSFDFDELTIQTASTVPQHGRSMHKMSIIATEIARTPPTRESNRSSLWKKLIYTVAIVPASAAMLFADPVAASAADAADDRSRGVSASQQAAPASDDTDPNPPGSIIEVTETVRMQVRLPGSLYGDTYSLSCPQDYDVLWRDDYTPNETRRDGRVADLKWVNDEGKEVKYGGSSTSEMAEGFTGRYGPDGNPLYSGFQALKTLTGIIDHGEMKDVRVSWKCIMSNAYSAPKFKSEGVKLLPEDVVYGIVPTVGQHWGGYRVKASGVPAPTFHVTQGELPPGLTLDATSGLVSGTTTADGVYTFTISARNRFDQASQEHTITSVGAPQWDLDNRIRYVANPGNASPKEGSPLDYTPPGAAKAVVPVVYEILDAPNGNPAKPLHKGVQFDSATGRFHGNPQEIGSRDFFVYATIYDNDGSVLVRSDARQFRLNVL